MSQLLDVVAIAGFDATNPSFAACHGIRSQLLRFFRSRREKGSTDRFIMTQIVLPSPTEGTTT